MIAVTPPASTPYIPSTCKIAFVNVTEQADELHGICRITYQPLDDKKQPVPFRPADLPGQLTPAQVDAYKAAPGVVADDRYKSISRAALPVVAANLGLDAATLSVV